MQTISVMGESCKDNNTVCFIEKHTVSLPKNQYALQTHPYGTCIFSIVVQLASCTPG